MPMSQDDKLFVIGRLDFIVWTNIAIMLLLGFVAFMMWQVVY